MRKTLSFGHLHAMPAGPLAIAALAGALVAGCSTDVQRFGYTGTAAPTAALPERPMAAAPVEPVGRAPLGSPPATASRYDPGSAYVNGSTYGNPVARTAGYTPPSYTPPSYTPPSYTPPSAYAAPASIPSPARGGSASGGTVTVGSGDTAFSIARRNGVTVEQLAAANGLSYPYAIRIGQSLTIPGGGGASSPSYAAPSHAARSYAETPASVPAPTRVAARGGQHTVAPGDTLYNISRRYGVGVAALADENRLDDYASIRIGQSLSIPGGGSESAQGGPLQVAARTPETESRIFKPRTALADDPLPAPGAGGAADVGNAASSGHRVPAESIPGESRQASADPEDAGVGQFRWPVRGRIISRYGIGADGQRNDGINISVPEGASVKAAESGVVAYAGNELKGYGNLILIRHANDWVTAYAHNSELLVQRGDTIQRGQIIAKAGQTGSVDKPQVHFEVRQGSKAVDPMPYLDGA